MHLSHPIATLHPHWSMEKLSSMKPDPGAKKIGDHWWKKSKPWRKTENCLILIFLLPTAYIDWVANGSITVVLGTGDKRWMRRGSPGAEPSHAVGRTIMCRRWLWTGPHAPSWGVWMFPWSGANAGCKYRDAVTRLLPQPALGERDCYGW